jgi:hypothetical protein
MSVGILKLFSFKAPNEIVMCFLAGLLQVEEVATLVSIFKNNRDLSANVSEELVAHVVQLIEHKSRSAVFLEFLQVIVCVYEKEIESTQEIVAQEVSFFCSSLNFSPRIKLFSDAKFRMRIFDFLFVATKAMRIELQDVVIDHYKCKLPNSKTKNEYKRLKI